MIHHPGISWCHTITISHDDLSSWCPMMIYRHVISWWCVVIMHQDPGPSWNIIMISALCIIAIYNNDLSCSYSIMAYDFSMIWQARLYHPTLKLSLPSPADFHTSVSILPTLSFACRSGPAGCSSRTLQRLRKPWARRASLFRKSDARRAQGFLSLWRVREEQPAGPLLQAKDSVGRMETEVWKSAGEGKLSFKVGW